MMSYFNRGHFAWEAGHLLSAFRLFLRGAKEGDESCQQVLGYFYDEGIGIAPNVKNAIYWYDRACTHGRSSSAAYNLSLLYEMTGHSKLSMKYLRRAADLGDEDARRKIAWNRE